METSLSDKKSDIYLEFSIDRQSERKYLKIIVFIKRKLCYLVRTKKRPDESSFRWAKLTFKIQLQALYKILYALFSII